MPPKLTEALNIEDTKALDRMVDNDLEDWQFTRDPEEDNS